MICRGREGEDEGRDRGVDPGFGGVRRPLPLGTMEGDAGKRSYQERGDAASTDPVACRVRSPVWLVYDILEKRDLVTLQAGAVEIRRK